MRVLVRGSCFTELSARVRVAPWRRVAARSASAADGRNRWKTTISAGA